MDYPAYRFTRAISELRAKQLRRELEEWQTRAQTYLRDEAQRVDAMSIAQRVHERRSQSTR